MACVAYFPALESTLENLCDMLSILLSQLGILAQILGDLLNNRADIELSRFLRLQSTLENLRDILSIPLSRLGILAQVSGELLSDRAYIMLRRFLRRRFSLGGSWTEDAMRHIHLPFPCPVHP